jgi:hypothetical protein
MSPTPEQADAERLKSAVYVLSSSLLRLSGQHVPLRAGAAVVEDWVRTADYTRVSGFRGRTGNDRG